MEFTDLVKARNVLRVALYVRVSTQEQAKEGYSIGEQTERLKMYAAAMGWEIYKVYVDPGYSGGDTDRPGLQSMIHDIKNGGIDKVVVYKLDRLSRSQLDTLYLIEKVFLVNNTDFVSMNENFDTSTPFGRAMIGILAVFAQLEREQIKERMNMGKEARAKEGKWHGGAWEPIGYDYNVENDTLYINEYEKMQMLELADLVIHNVPLRRIETLFIEKGYKHKYGVWDPKTMRRVLRNKTNIGLIKHNDTWYPGTQEAIFTQEIYDKANKNLDDRAEQYALTGIKPGVITTYLGGLLYCKHCGGKYHKQENGRRKEGKPRVYWYSCHSRSKKVKKMIKDPTCKNKNWKVTALDKIVLDEIEQLGTDPEFITAIRNERKTAQSEEPNKIELIERKIDQIDEQISRFMDLYGIGKFTIDQVSSKTDPLNEERTKLKKELETLNAEAGRLSVEEAFEIAESFSEAREFGDFDEIRALIESLIYYIEIDNDDVTIHWKFV